MTSATQSKRPATVALPRPFDIDGDGRIDVVENELRTRVSQPAKRRVLQSRYDVLGQLGQGGQAKTYLAIDHHSCSHVVLKVLEIELASDWKSIELFEREAELLQQIDHPRIPAYIDHFRRVVGEKTQFVTVQQFVHGDDLSRLLDRGVRWTPDEASARILELIEILEPLHRRTPPVIHRDIKPSNIILGEDGHLHLVDFGAAQAIVPTTAGGSTIIGTTGFVPMEQYMGRAVPASDIYALGATVLQMVTGQHPADFELRHSKPQFEAHVSDSKLRDVLERMLEPHVEQRVQSTRDLRDALEVPVNAMSVSVDRSNIVPYQNGVRDGRRPWLVVYPTVLGLTRSIGRARVTSTTDAVSFSTGRIGPFGGGLAYVLTIIILLLIVGLEALLVGPLVAPFGLLALHLSLMYRFRMRAGITELGSRTVSTRSIQRFERDGSGGVFAVMRREALRLELPEMSADEEEYLVALLESSRKQLIRDGTLPPWDW